MSEGGGGQTRQRLCICEAVEQTLFVQHGAEAKNRSAVVARRTEQEVCVAVTIGYCYVANQPQTQ